MSPNSKSRSRCIPRAHAALRLGAASLVSVSVAGVVQAQEAGSESRMDLQEIVVTGTRIRGVEAPIGSNLIAIDAAEIRDTGRATTAELLRSVPQVTNLGFDESRTNGAQRAIANSFGGSSINLRGLGVEATLTLLDGRRPLAGGGEGRWFDPNSIPSIALERVEVVADGSSAIYGSDAMTGVVNLITRRNYRGAETVINYGGADGYDQVQVQQLLGMTFERGSVLAALEYFDRDNLETRDRWHLYDHPAADTFVAYPANIGTAGFVDANNNGIYDPGENSGPRHSQSSWLGVDVLPKQERKTVFLYGDFEVNDRIKLYGEGYYSKREFQRNLTALSFSNLSVPATNPYNASGAPATVTYSFINDMGPQNADGFEEFWQAMLGATFSLGKDWQIDAFASYGETVGQRDRNTINNGALAAALASTSTDTAFNPFSNGTTGWPSQTVKSNVLTAISQVESLRPSLDYLDAQLKADGPLFAIPGGDVRLAVGVEHQKQWRANSITTRRATDVLRNILPDQEREVESIFAELFVPIVGSGNAVPGIHSLSLSLAARYDKYDDIQLNPGLKLLDTDTTNPKFGVTWQPIESLTFRGTYGTSFRAPALGDYSLGAPTVLAPVPVSPQVAAAYGLPPSANGQYAAVNLQGGHTLGLTPEESTTWSFGLEWRPQSIDGLYLSATYYNIKFEDQIAIPANTGSLQSLDVVDALVNSTSSFVLPGLGFVIFNPTDAQLQAYMQHGGAATARIGPLAAANLCGAGSPGCGAGGTVPVYALIDSLSNNTGILETDGIDFAARYTWETGIGSWTVGNTFTYVLNYDQALVSSLPLTDFRNQVNFPLKFQSRTQLGWNFNNWSAVAYVNYQNSYSNTGVSPLAKVDSYTTVDLRVAYDTGDLGNWFSNVTVAVSALNAFDEDPPLALVTQGAAIQKFDSQNASPVGRFVSLQVSKRW